MHVPTIAIIFILALFALANVNAQYLYVDSSMTIPSAATYDSVRVVAGGVLIVDDSLYCLNNFVIDSGGEVTHSSRNLFGLQLVVGGALQVDGSIDVSEKGLLGGPGGNWSDNSGDAGGIWR